MRVRGMRVERRMGWSCCLTRVWAGVQNERGSLGGVSRSDGVPSTIVRFPFGLET